jgi:hypothetical protein
VDNEGPTEKTREVDGEHRVFRDALLDKMIGRWEITGSMMGQPLRQRGEAEWVLNHQFIRIFFRDATVPRGPTKDPPYEAYVYVGFDNMSERYVMHWLDTFGGRYSEVLGYGVKKLGRDSISFIFEGGTGPLRNTISWDFRTSTWRMLIKQKNTKGEWYTFVDETLRRI